MYKICNKNSGVFTVKTNGRLQVGGSLKPGVPFTVQNEDGSNTTTTVDQTTRLKTIVTKFSNGNVHTSVYNLNTNITHETLQDSDGNILD